MPKSVFSPKTIVFFENMPVVREALLAFQVGGDIEKELSGALTHVQDLAGFPQKDSRRKKNKLSLYLVPDKSWEVVEKDSIAICVSFEQVIQPGSLLEEDDPFVGIYVPPTWSKLKQFNEELKACLPVGFQHIRGNPLYDESVPVWASIHFPKQKKFREQTFFAEIEALIEKLLAKKPEIDAAIRKVKSRPSTRRNTK